MLSLGTSAIREATQEREQQSEKTSGGETTRAGAETRETARAADAQPDEALLRRPNIQTVRFHNIYTTWTGPNQTFAVFKYDSSTVVRED